MRYSLNINLLKTFILDILFPQKCVGCGIKNETLCDNCISKIPLTDRETSEDITALFDYRDPSIKKAIWELKYHNKRYLGEKLGSLLYEFLIEDISEIKMNISGRSIFVIPIPSSSRKTKKRGYNQAESIARGFCNSSPDKVFELKNKIIYKKIDTIPQAKIKSRKRRLQNVVGVFDIKNPEIVQGRTIIIIDDVTTTGATIKEVLKILKKARAKKVIGFTVAH